MGKIILASSSPRRREILKTLKYKFEVIPSPYVEQHAETDFSYDYAENLAVNKALAVVPLVEEPSLIIGADTIVVSDNKILEKPKDFEDAFTMLETLSGKKHFVVTSIAVINSQTGEININSTTTFVEFEKLSSEQIKNYIEKFEPYDKAGAYGIQELPPGFVKSVEGSFENVIGLCPKALEKLIKHYTA